MVIPGVRKKDEFWTRLDLTVLKAVEVALDRHEKKCFQERIQPIRKSQSKLVWAVAGSSGAVGVLSALVIKMIFGR
jgi:hypothetical protein